MKTFIRSKSDLFTADLSRRRPIFPKEGPEDTQIQHLYLGTCLLGEFFEVHRVD